MRRLLSYIFVIQNEYSLLLLFIVVPQNSRIVITYEFIALTMKSLSCSFDFPLYRRISNSYISLPITDLV